MQPYAASQINSGDQLLFDKIRICIGVLPEIDLGKDGRFQKIPISCHLLARAVADVFDVKAVDGKFLDAHDHSWTETRSGNIIDVYPIASLGGPILWDSNAPLLTKLMYERMSEKESEEYYSWSLDPSFFPNVQLISNELEKISNRLGIRRTVAAS